MHCFVSVQVIIVVSHRGDSRRPDAYPLMPNKKSSYPKKCPLALNICLLSIPNNIQCQTTEFLKDRVFDSQILLQLLEVHMVLWVFGKKPKQLRPRVTCLTRLCHLKDRLVSNYRLCEINTFTEIAKPSWWIGSYLRQSLGFNEHSWSNHCWPQSIFHHVQCKWF